MVFVLFETHGWAILAKESLVQLHEPRSQCGAWGDTMRFAPAGPRKECASSAVGALPMGARENLPLAATVGYIHGKRTAQALPVRTG